MTENKPLDDKTKIEELVEKLAKGGVSRLGGRQIESDEDAQRKIAEAVDRGKGANFTGGENGKKGKGR